MNKIPQPLSQTTQWKVPLKDGVCSTLERKGQKPLVINRCHKDKEFPLVIHMFGAQNCIDVETSERLSDELQRALRCIKCKVSPDGYNCAVSAEGTCNADRQHPVNRVEKDDLWQCLHDRSKGVKFVKGPPQCTWWILLALTGAAVATNILLFLERIGWLV